MKMVKSLLLGTAAGHRCIVWGTGRRSSRKGQAGPVREDLQSVWCRVLLYPWHRYLYQDRRLRLREEVNFNAQGSYARFKPEPSVTRTMRTSDQWRSRSGVIARCPLADRIRHTAQLRRRWRRHRRTARLLQRTKVPNRPWRLAISARSANDPYTALWSNAAFIQFAGFTAGKLGSFFDYDLQPYSNQTNFWGSNLAGGGIDLFAYTAQLGNGLSASIAAEDAPGHRMQVSDGTATTCRCCEVQPLESPLCRHDV